VPVVDGAKAFEHLDHRLVELSLTRVPRQYCVPDGLQPCIHESVLNSASNGQKDLSAAYG
jgi:hypothetical protein